MAFLIHALGCPVIEGKQRQERLGDDFEIRFGGKALRQILRPGDMVADHRPQAFEAVIAQQEPELQRAEAAAERHRPFRIVDDAVMAMGAQIFGLDRQRADQRFRLAHELDGAIELRAEPFMRIEDDGIGAFDALPQVTEFRADHRRARPGGIDMHIEPMCMRHFNNGGDIIAGADAGAADAGDDAGRQQPGRAIALDCGGKRLRVHGLAGPPRGNAHQIFLTDAGNPDGAVDRGVNLIGGVDADRLVSGKPARIALPVQRSLAHDQNGGKGCGRGRILNDAGEGFRHAERLAQPIDHFRFKFRRGWRCLPEHALGGDGADQIFGDHRNGGRIGGEIGKEARMLPMRHAGNEDILEILEDILHGFACYRRGISDMRGDLPRCRLRPYRPVPKRRAIIRSPIRRFLRPLPELLPIHDGPPFSIKARRTLDGFSEAVEYQNSSSSAGPSGTIPVGLRDAIE